MFVLFSAAGMLLRELTPTEADGRLPSTKLTDMSRNSACRCLFGRPSSDSTIQAYLDDSSRRRWNFDFAAMQPLSPGRFEWTSCAVDTLPVHASRSVTVPLGVGNRASSSTDNDFQRSSGFQHSAVQLRFHFPVYLIYNNLLLCHKLKTALYA